MAQDSRTLESRSTDGDVRYSVVGEVATIILDRPTALNAINVRLLRGLVDAVAAAVDDRAVRSIVLTGAGEKAFCAGGDLTELIPRLTRGELSILVPDPTKRFFSDCYKPIVAAVNGLCLAGGLEILLGTDIRVSSATATFGLPEVRWGLVPGAGTHVRLPQQIPWAISMKLLLTGDHIDAAEAGRHGLVSEVVPVGVDVRARAGEIATRIAQNSPSAVQTAKEIAVRSLSNEPRFALEFALNERVLRGPDATEGPKAFAEKRLPRYRDL